MLFINKKKRTEEVTDAVLLEKYSSTGNIDFLGTLYNRYMHLVYGVCMKYLKDRDDSKDAVMQIFEKLVILLKNEKIRDFNHWIYTVTRNYCLMILRDQKRHSLKEEIHVFMETEEIPHLGNDGIMEEDIEKLQDCLGTLPDQQKTCVELFYFEQKSYREIAELTMFDLNNIKSYIQNGKRNLKICIENKKNGQ
jgi:RNA polymerase sigma factor (sigma-70 family)